MGSQQPDVQGDVVRQFLLLFIFPIPQCYPMQCSHYILKFYFGIGGVKFPCDPSLYLLTAKVTF